MYHWQLEFLYILTISKPDALESVRNDTRISRKESVSFDFVEAGSAERKMRFILVLNLKVQ